MNSISDYAAAFADELAIRYDSDPEGELGAWVQVALEREAMVAVVYSPDRVDSHLNRLRDRRVDPNAIEVVRTALSDVWSQEATHQRLLETALITLKDYKGFLDETKRTRLAIYGKLREKYGMLQGFVMSWKTSPDLLRSVLGKLGIAVGNLLLSVPEFVSHIEVASFEEFCETNADLETTAVMGYDRMLALLATLRRRKFLAETIFPIMIRRARDDEKYHREVFLTLGAFFGPSGGGTGGTPGGGTSSGSLLDRLEEVQRRIYPTPELAHTRLEIDPAALAADPFIGLLRLRARRGKHEPPRFQPPPFQSPPPPFVTA